VRPLRVGDEGYVRYAQLTCDNRSASTALVGEDDEAFYGYPGDVIYPKTDWSLTGIGKRVAIAEYAELEHQAFERAWAARQQ
jgi:hypothetical protein